MNREKQRGDKKQRGDVGRRCREKKEREEIERSMKIDAAMYAVLSPLRTADCCP